MSHRFKLLRRVVSSGFSFDKVAITTIVAGSVVWIYSAYQEGSFPLTKQCHSSECRSSVDDSSKQHCHAEKQNRLQLTPEKCRQFQRDGFLVIDDFLTPTEVRNAFRCAQRVEARRHDKKLETAAFFVGIRKDSMCFMDADYVGATETVPSEAGDHYQEDHALHHVRDLLRSVADTIATSDFTGFQEGASTMFRLDPNGTGTGTSTSTSASTVKDDQYNKENDNAQQRIITTTIDRYRSPRSWIGVPDTIQLSLYHPLDRSDNHHEQHSKKPKSNYNHAHRDGTTGDWWNTGVIGYMRSHYLRKRYITCIVYVNDDSGGSGDNDDIDRNNTGPWMEADGGYLRLFLGARMSDMTGESIGQENNPGSRILDLSPKGGRLVLLSSEHVLHAVMPSFRQRVACSMWLTLNQ